MKMPVWLHHFDSGYGPGVLGGAADEDLPISHIYGKTNDGLSWMGRWDTDAEAIGSLGALLKVATQRFDGEIPFVPWGVIHGRWEGVPDQAEREGRLAGLIARAAAWRGGAAVYIVDLEPHYHASFKAFWRNDLGAGALEVLQFLSAFQEAGGTEIWVAPDARATANADHLKPVSFDMWAQHPTVTRVLPQVYYTDFVKPNQPTEATVQHSLDRAVLSLAQHGWADTSTIHPIFPGDSPAALIPFASTASDAMGMGKFSIWQRGTLTSATAGAIKAIP